MNKVDTENKFIFCFITCLLYTLLTSFNNSDFALGQTPLLEKYQKVFTTDISYGLTKNGLNRKRLGVVRGEHVPPRGPESFANDAEGNFYICDTVNRRIQIYSPEGTYQGRISLRQNTVPNDVVIDDRKVIYVYDDFQGKLHQIDKSGALLNSINVDRRRWKCRSAMHMVNNTIYVTSCDQEDLLIGKIENGQLEAPTDEDTALYSTRGILGPSGKRYLVKLTKWKKGEIFIIDNAGAVINSVDLSLSEILSIKFLKEDKKCNFYVQTERVEDEEIVLEVNKFGPNGSFLCTVLIPENDYKIWSVKLLSVDENGHIWQLLPEIEKARLNVFKEIDE